jgi:phytoene synthase
VSAPVAQGITRRSASNLALAFVLLPPERRRAMAALYAFCREVDDVADEAAVPSAERRARLAAWRADVRRACGGEVPEFAVNRELQPVIAQYHLPFGLFDELLRGVEMDLDVHRYGTYAELEGYCYRVASVVGLLSIEIFGHQDPGCHDYAIALGQALQFTNILRDVGTDALRGRIYLPLEELARHQVAPEDVLAQRDSPRFRAAAAAVARRARAYYAKARDALPASDRRAMVAAEVMGAVYWSLLRRLEASGFAILGRAPVRLSRGHKAGLVLRTWFRIASGRPTPNYGGA